MHKTLGMGIAQPPGGLRDHRGRRHLVQWAVLEHLLAEVDAGHDFGDEVIHFSVVPRIQCAHEVCMIQPSQHANLSLKSCLCFGSRLSSRQHLYGNFAAHHHVFGFEHLSHASLSDLIQNSVLAQHQPAAARQHLVGLKASQRALLHEQSCDRFVKANRIQCR